MATAAETIAIYNAVLQRDPTDAELAAFVTASQTPETEAVQIDLLINSGEAQDDVWPFVRVYQAIFGRVPDAAGLNFWVDAMRSGVSLQTIVEGDEAAGIDGFKNSAEFVAEYGADVDPTSEAFITALYQNLLGRAPDEAGLEFFTNLPDSATVGDVVTAFTESPEFSDAINTQIRIFLEAAAEGTQDYVGSVYDVDNDGDVDQDDQDIVDDAPLPEGELFTLTVGVDEVTGTGGNDTIRAITGASLETIDVIDGAGGDDVLNISAGAIAAAGEAPVIEGVERINNSDTTSLSLAAVSGVNQIWSRASSAYTAAALGVVFGVENTAGAAVTVELGAGVDLSGDADSVSLAAANNTGAVSVSFADTGGIAGSADADIEAVNVAAGADAGTVSLVNFTAAETVTLTGEGDVTLTVGAANAALATVDASAATGDVTVDASGVVALESATGGAGDDALTITTAGSTADAITVDGGAGLDTITVNAATAADTTVSLTGGADEDTFAFSALANVEDEANFEDSLITITDFNADEDVLDLSALGAYDELTNVEAADVADETTLEAAIDVAGGYTTAAGITAFEYEGDTYILASADGGALADNDGLIKLTGVALADLDSTAFLTA